MVELSYTSRRAQARKMLTVSRIALMISMLLSAGVVFNAVYLQRPQPAPAEEQAQPRAVMIATAPTSKRSVRDHTSAFEEASPEGAAPVATIPLEEEGSAELTIADLAEAALAGPFTGPAHRQAEPTTAADRAAQQQPALDPKTTAAIQRELFARGYDPGPPDGLLTLETRAAIMAFESDQGLTLTAEPSEAVLEALLLGVTGTVDAGAPSGEAVKLIARAQSLLGRQGFEPGRRDGTLDESTIAAIRRFERAAGLPVTGRIGAQLMSELARRAGASLANAGG
jgi:peptidoglycan hydrolase-like protein with peptidoglycan-binding domain